MSHPDNMGIPSPDDILKSWRALVATGAHVHLPQIAAHVHAPEAALLSARIGSGATRLRPDLVRVLEPIRDWHRVLMVAPTRLGVFMPMGAVTEFSASLSHLRLSGPSLRARIDLSSVREIYIFEDHDPARGTSKSIQAFDAAGAPLLKVVIFHKPSFRAARDWTAALVHPDQSRDWHPGLNDPTPKQSDRELSAAPTQPFVEELEKAAATGRRLSINAFRPGLELGWSGTLTGVRREGNMLHLHESTLRAHLNLARAIAAETEGAASLQIHVPGQKHPALAILDEVEA